MPLREYMFADENRVPNPVLFLIPLRELGAFLIFIYLHLIWN